MKRFVTIAVLVLACSARGQLSTDEAKARLDELNRKAAAARGTTGDTSTAAKPATPPPTALEIQVMMNGDPHAAVVRMSPYFHGPRTDTYLAYALSVAYMRSKQYGPARACMDVAYAKTESPTKALALDNAWLEIAQRPRTMNATKAMAKYFEAHPEPDETAVNLLGTALAKAAESPQIASSAEFGGYADLYTRKNAELELRRADRLKHYGCDWISTQRYKDIQQQKRDADDDSRRLVSELGYAEDSLKKATENYDARNNDLLTYTAPTTAANARGYRPYAIQDNNADRQRLNDAANNAAKDRNDAQAHVNAIRNQISQINSRVPKPNWLASFEPLWDASSSTTQPAAAN